VGKLAFLLGPRLARHRSRIVATEFAVCLADCFGHSMGVDLTFRGRLSGHKSFIANELQILCVAG
jgi:hypothetical protein